MTSSKTFLIISTVVLMILFIIFIANALQYNNRRMSTALTAADIQTANTYFWANVIGALMAIGLIAASIYYIIARPSKKKKVEISETTVKETVVETVKPNTQDTVPLYTLASPTVVYSAL